MVYSFDGFNYLVRLDKGEQLSQALEKFAVETKIWGAWVSGVGATSQATLGFYDLGNKQYSWQRFDGLREIVSLSGNLAFDEEDQFVAHLHAVLGDDQYQTVGGHVKDMVAGATIELFVHRAYQPTKRKMDQAVGIKVLDLK
jgi:predicted DNA-binding protein with PD1-like motif